jgi:hypothetical protein
MHGEGAAVEQKDGSWTVFLLALLGLSSFVVPLMSWNSL